MTIEGQQRIHVDVTGILAWGHDTPTGVQRVEHQIYRHCRERGDVGFVWHDRAAGTFHALPSRLLGLLDRVVGIEPSTAGAGISAAIRGAHVRLRIRERGTIRQIAREATGTGRFRGLRYDTLKVALRGLGIVIRLQRRAASRQRGRGRPVAADSEISRPLLVSQMTISHPNLARDLSESGFEPVFLIHDLIPVDYPDRVPPNATEDMLRLLLLIREGRFRVATVSNAVRSDILRWYGIDGEEAFRPDVRVCPMGSSLDREEAADAPIPELAGKRFALYCSSLQFRKRQDVLIAAWAEIARRAEGIDLPELVFIGRIASGYEAVAAALDAHPTVAPKVHCLGNLDDAQLRWAYHNAWLGVFSSELEGWGLGVSEALAHGLPVVHSDIPPLREAAQGLMPAVKAGDEGAWADRLEELMAHPEKVEALRMTVRERYDPGSPDDFAKGLVEYLQEAADAASPRQGLRSGHRSAT